MKENITIGEKYGPAMEITDEAEAARYFEECVKHNMHCSGKTREEAIAIELSNLGYFSGYYDTETRGRVQRLYGAVHPVFGRV